jgi:hypothetical protein
MGETIAGAGVPAYVDGAAASGLENLPRRGNISTMIERHITPALLDPERSALIHVGE